MNSWNLARKRARPWMITLLAVAVSIGACTSAAPTESPTSAPAPTQTPAPTAASTETVVVPEGALAILPTPAAGEPSLEAAQNVNMRSGPGLNYPVLAVLSGGMKAILVGISPDGAYYAVSLPVTTSGQGWVDANFAIVTGTENMPVIQPPPVPPTAEFIGPQPGDPQGTADETVFVRSGPGDQYPAFGVAPAGSTGLIFGISADGQWWAVRLNPENVGAGHGWVEAAFVTTQNTAGLPVIQAPPVPTPVSVPPPAAGAPLARALDFVNVRTGPGQNYPAIGVAPQGASAEVSGVSSDGQWWQVVLPTTLASSGRGWVSASYVITENTENVPVVEAPPPPPVAPTQPPGAFGCILISQSPADGTVFAAGTSLDMTWQLQNTSSESWSASGTSLQFFGAVSDARLSSADQVPLTTDVPQGGTYQATVSMTTPGTAGQFGEVWGIVQGDTTLCQFYNIIEVQ